jgi:hypothetical protein
MPGIPSPFSDDGHDADDTFDEYDEFVPEHLPEPGAFLDGHDALVGEDHLDFHDLTRDLFEERGVYDTTFGYNLARLNLDTRHLKAGYRYAVETNGGDGSAADDHLVLRAEFTPTTEPSVTAGWTPRSPTSARAVSRGASSRTADHPSRGP